MDRSSPLGVREFRQHAAGSPLSSWVLSTGNCSVVIEEVFLALFCPHSVCVCMCVCRDASLICKVSNFLFIFKHDSKEWAKIIHVNTEVCSHLMSPPSLLGFLFLSSFVRVMSIFFLKLRFANFH